MKKIFLFIALAIMASCTKNNSVAPNNSVNNNNAIYRNVEYRFGSTFAFDTLYLEYDYIDLNSKSIHVFDTINTNYFSFKFKDPKIYLAAKISIEVAHYEEVDVFDSLGNELHDSLWFQLHVNDTMAYDYGDFDLFSIWFSY